MSAADVTATSCARNAVQNAIDSAANGDTVLVPSGVCVWTTSVTIPASKSITLQGAALGLTTIVDGITDGNPIEVVVSRSTFSRITGFTFDAAGVAKIGNNAVIEITGEGLNAFRVDHNVFLDLRSRGIIVKAGGNELYGVIDSNSFAAPFDAAAQSVTVMGSGTQNGEPFSRPYEPGSDRFVFVEDNVFLYAYQNDGGVEGYGGARYVLRHNQVHGVTQGHHGADSGNFRGTHSFEMYENIFDQIGCIGCSGGERKHHLRSGTGFIFNNSYTWGGRIHLDNYRSKGSYGIWGECDGSDPHDQNVPGQQGYACLDQIGHVFDENGDGTNSLEPLYVFGNRENGNQTDAVPVSHARLETYHIVENRDFFNEDPDFDGTNGVGIGPIGNRPSSCVLNTGYWATDQSIFYRCGAGSVWAENYRPYAYPHPLRSPDTIAPTVAITAPLE
jgi:hypothetical protein